MNSDSILELFKNSGAFLEGHFLLTSGLHAASYIQCARILEDPKLTEPCVQELAKSYSGKRVDWVVGPAMGGIVFAYELARALGAKAAFTERVDGKMALRRGFRIQPKETALLAEDVLTTGGSAAEVARLLEAQGAEVIGVALLVDRSGVPLPFPKTALLSLKLTAVPANECPLCKTGVPILQPGSRQTQPSR